MFSLSGRGFDSRQLHNSFSTVVICNASDGEHYFIYIVVYNGLAKLRFNTKKITLELLQKCWNGHR